jgi:hypothetical protein
MLRNYTVIVGFVALFGTTTGCSKDESSPTTEPKEVCDDVGLCLTEPASGFQIRSDGYQIQAGDDVEYCEVIALPGTPSDKYYVRGFEVAMTQFSHHLIVSAVQPGTDTDANTTVGDRVPCTGGDVFGGELDPVTGSQQPYHESMYPDGVGRVYSGGQKLIFDYHYFNTSAEVVDARAAVNFHTTTEDKIQRIVQSFAMINVGISIEPGQEAEFTNGCLFDQDIEVFSLTRHTHRWGTDFNVWFKGGERDGEHVFLSEEYEDVEYQFPEPVIMAAGTGFDFSCAFQNTETYTLEFGLKATDEMCILFGDWVVPNVGDTPEGQACILF